MNAEAELEAGSEDQEELDRVVIKDNGEPLVNFLGLSRRLVFSPAHPLFDFPRTPLIRKSVAEMLVQAAESLPTGLLLSVVEGYRPIQVQRAMHKWVTEDIKKEHPEWNDDHIRLEAGRRSAPPDAITPPPHITGGAVDVDIIDQDGNGLDFSSPYSKTEWQQASPRAKGLSEKAYENRALLKRIMEPTGLTNYVDEWWHWSYGDNGWALRVGASYACYGRIELPDEVEWIGDITKFPQE